MKIVDNYKLQVIEKLNYKNQYKKNIEYKEKLCNGVITQIDENDITPDGLLILPEGAKFIVGKYGQSIITNSTNKLKKIIIPSTFKSFGESAFVNEKNLECIEVLDNDNEINFDCDAFLNCGLKKLIIDKALNISEGTFNGNKELKTISINHLNNLEAHSFSLCTNLESVTIKNNPVHVQGADFEYCPNIKEMILGYGYRLQVLVGGKNDAIISGDCFKKEEPFKVTYIVNLDKQRKSYPPKQLEELIRKLARYQFFEIDNYRFINGEPMDKFCELGIDILMEQSKLSYRLSKTEFYFKIIFSDFETLIVPINDYFKEEDVTSSKVLEKIR